MNTKIYYVVLVNDWSYFISDGESFQNGDTVVFEGSWEACRKFIDPTY